MFKRIAYIGNIDIYMHVDGYASFFSSHYTPHLNCAAVDISNSLEFGDDALSPISGVVEKIYKIEAPYGKYSKVDYIIGLRLSGTSYRAKLMHITPTVSLNERVEVGDPIGKYIRSNYFSYHHLPHIHLEISRDSSLRPSRAIKLKLCKEFISYMGFDFNTLLHYATIDSLPVNITDVGEGFILCKILDGLPAVLSATSKLSLGFINGQLGIGLCYLGYIHLTKKPNINEKVILTSTTVGYIKKHFEWCSLVVPKSSMSLRRWLSEHEVLDLLSGFDSSSQEFLVVTNPNNLAVKGLEFLISRKAQLKLILEPNERRLDLSRNSVVEVKVVRKRVLG